MSEIRLNLVYIPNPRFGHRYSQPTDSGRGDLKTPKGRRIVRQVKLHVHVI